MNETAIAPQAIKPTAGSLRWLGALGALGPLLALFVLILIGTAMSDAFLSYENVTNVLTRSSIIGIIAIGTTFVITAGGLDLSVGAMSALITGITIIVMNHVAGPLGATAATVAIGFAAALLLGGLLGFANGALIVFGGIDAFIVTLGSMGIFRSLLTYLADGGSINLDFGLRSVARPIYYGELMGIGFPILVLLVLAVVGEVALRRMRFGRHVAAIGSNREVARFSAIHVDRVRIGTYVIQGLCVALATMIYIPRLGAATPSTGMLWELEAIAAVIIGGTMLNGGFGRVWGSIVGVLILGLIGNLLNLTSWLSPHLNGAFQGAIIIIAVVLQRGERRA